MERTEGYIKRKDNGIDCLKKELQIKVKEESTPIKLHYVAADEVLKSSKRYHGMSFDERQKYYKERKDGF